MLTQLTFPRGPVTPGIFGEVTGQLSVSDGEVCLLTQHTGKIPVMTLHPCQLGQGSLGTLVLEGFSSGELPAQSSELGSHPRDG